MNPTADAPEASVVPDDLVKRLRATTRYSTMSGNGPEQWHSIHPTAVGLEAAAEIERLRMIEKAASTLAGLLWGSHSEQCEPPEGKTMEQWCSYCHALAEFRAAGGVRA